jgi:hypothetical protein
MNETYIKTANSQIILAHLRFFVETILSGKRELLAILLKKINRKFANFFSALAVLFYIDTKHN